MRDLVVFALIVLSLPYCFRRPFFGLLMFTWLAYMRPQDLCWGFARTMRFSFYVGLTMFAGYLANEVGKRPFYRHDIRTNCMVVLLVGTILTTIPAEVFDEHVFSGLFEFTVIITVSLFSAGQLDSRLRIRIMLWTIALSLGFYGAKGGVFAFLGGTTIHQGPGGMMKDNNDFALAMVMAIPLLWYLGRSEKNQLVKKFALVVAGLTCVTIVLTKSRGGFLAMVVAFLVIAYRSRKLFRALLTSAVVAVVFLQVVPEETLDRYRTIEEAAEGAPDSSVQARFRAWAIGMRMIEHNPILGVGHKNFRHHYHRHADVLFPGADLFNHVAHNSYIQIWAENGTPLFLVFLLILVSSFFATRRIRRLALSRGDALWAEAYANAVEASLAGFMVGAFFLNRGHFDLSYQIAAIATALLYVVRRDLASEPATATTPGAVRPDPEPIRPAWRPATLGPSRLPRWERTS